MAGRRRRRRRLLLLLPARWPGRALTYQRTLQMAAAASGDGHGKSREESGTKAFVWFPPSFLSCLLSHSTSRSGWGVGESGRGRTAVCTQCRACVRAGRMGGAAARRGRSSCVVGLRRIEGSSVLPCRHIVRTTRKQRRWREASCRRRCCRRSESQSVVVRRFETGREVEARVDVVARSLALCCFPVLACELRESRNGGVGTLVAADWS